MILRKKKSRFTIVNNEVIEDRNLSYRALGLLAYLLSKPNNWQIMITELSTGREGRDAVYTAIKELINAGYVERKTIRDERNRVTGTEYIIRDYKNLIEKALNLENFPETDFPYTAFPDTENPTLLKTDILLNTDNTKITKSEKKIQNEDFHSSGLLDIEIKIPKRDGEEFVITQEFFSELCDEYPELKHKMKSLLLRIEQWNRSDKNKKRRKVHVDKHIRNWLSHESERMKTGKGFTQYKRPGAISKKGNTDDFDTGKIDY